MVGSLYFVAIVAVVAVLATGVGALWIIPIIVVVLAATALNPVLNLIRNSRLAGPGPSGVPSTGDASFTPQQDPGERGIG